MIRRAETDADLAAWCDVWNAITPREPNELETVKRRLERQPERLYLVALKGDEAEASVLRFLAVARAHRDRSGCYRTTGGAASARASRPSSRMPPSSRGRRSGMVFEDDPDSIAWVTNRGFEEYDRQVELSRASPRPRPSRRHRTVSS